MKKIIFTIGVLIILIFGVLLKIKFGNYYNTPEAALMHYDKVETKWAEKKIVDIVWLNDDPVVFYISKSGDFCEAEYKKRKILGRTGWKIVTVGMLPSIREISSDVTVPNYMGAQKHTDNKQPNMVLFGVSKSMKANTIKIEGKIPTFKTFRVNGEKYVLWYTTSVYEPVNIDNIKITSA